MTRIKQCGHCHHSSKDNDVWFFCNLFKRPVLKEGVPCESFLDHSCLDNEKIHQLMSELSLLVFHKNKDE